MAFARPAPVIIIGAGVIGLWTADHLVRSGVRDVIVLDQSTPGSGTSGSGAGGVSVQQGTELDVELASASLAAYQDLSDSRPVPLTRRIGRLTIAGAHHDDTWGEAMAAIFQSTGHPVERLPVDQIVRRFPALNPDGIRYGLWTEPDSFLDIQSAVDRLVERLKASGVRIICGETVQAIIHGDHGITAVRTATGQYAASQIVVAAGVRSRSLLQASSLDAPLRSFRTQAVVVETHPPTPWPAVRDFTAQYYAIPQTQSHMLIGGGNYPVRDDVEPFGHVPASEEFMDEILDQFQRRFPGANVSRRIENWTGVVHTTPDDHPLLGPVSDVPGLWLACGVTGRGVSRAPALGACIAAMITQDPLPHPVSPFAPDRFDGVADFELDVVRRVP